MKSWTQRLTRWLYQQELGFVEGMQRCIAEGDRAPADRRVHHDPEKVYPLKNLSRSERTERMKNEKTVVDIDYAEAICAAKAPDAAS